MRSGTWRIQWLGGGAEEIRSRSGPGRDPDGRLDELKEATALAPAVRKEAVQSCERWSPAARNVEKGVGNRVARRRRGIGFRPANEPRNRRYSGRGVRFAGRGKFFYGPGEYAGSVLAGKMG